MAASADDIEDITVRVVSCADWESPGVVQVLQLMTMEKITAKTAAEYRGIGKQSCLVLVKGLAEIGLPQM